MVTKHPLLCAGCGTVTGWARRADHHMQGCPTCGKRTIFTITPVGVVKELAPPTPPKRQRRKPDTRAAIDRMMRTNHYVDWQKC